jgi:glutamyl-tRNA reductase
MSVLVVGISHRTAPVEVLERVALDDESARKLSADLLDSEHVSEAVIVSTCNRVEVYVAVDRFHGSVEAVSQILAQRAGTGRDTVAPHLFVHYDEAAVAHLFRVAAGLDSMVVGESQVLGQVRIALQRAQEHATAGSVLNALFQQALRVGKRGHAETGIDQAGRSVVTTALDHVERRTGSTVGRSRSGRRRRRHVRAGRCHAHRPRCDRHQRREQDTRASRPARRQRGWSRRCVEGPR